jgi:hypothetical protein
LPFSNTSVLIHVCKFVTFPTLVRFAFSTIFCSICKGLVLMTLSLLSLLLIV